MVGHQTLNLAIGVRVPASQPLKFNSWGQRCDLNHKFAATEGLCFQLRNGKLMVPISVQLGRPRFAAEMFGRQMKTAQRRAPGNSAPGGNLSTCSSESPCSVTPGKSYRKKSLTFPKSRRNVPAIPCLVFCNKY